MISMRSLMGVVFFVTSLYFVYRSFEKRREVKECNGSRVVATVVENKVQLVGSGMQVYYPVYSYEIDEENKTYQGKCASMFTMPIGTQVPLYYNHKTRTPVEGVSVVSEVTLAMFFGVVAAIMFN